MKNKVRVNKYEINNTHKPRPWLSVLVYEIFSPVVWVVEEGRGRDEGSCARSEIQDDVRAGWSTRRRSRSSMRRGGQEQVRVEIEKGKGR